MKERLQYVDGYKGLGILLMIAGHTGYIGLVDRLFSRIGLSFTIDQWVHAFHMPMFFIASGYLFTQKREEINIGQYIKRKVRTLLVPYIIFGLFHYCISILINYAGTGSFFDKDELYALFFMNSQNIPIAGALWFLTALFFCEIIWIVLYKYVTNKYILCTSIIALAVLGSTWTSLVSTRLPYSIDTAFVGVGLFAIGYCFRKASAIFVAPKDVIISVLCFVVGSVVSCFNQVNMRKGQYSNPVLFWIAAICISLSLLVICRAITELRERRKKACKYDIIHALENIGQYSIVYLCFNQIVIRQVKLLLPDFDIPIAYLIRCTCILLTLLLLYCIRIIVYNTNIRKILGKH